eukprot:m.171834 g.171834  ORF g.171834 m.171834 type:complete len:73 (-) comp15357_c0_seq7:2239-2457(-)
MMTDTTEKREALEIRPQNEYPSLIRNMAKPNMVSTESDVLSRVKAFLPELEQVCFILNFERAKYLSGQSDLT